MNIFKLKTPLTDLSAKFTLEDFLYLYMKDKIYSFAIIGRLYERIALKSTKGCQMTVLSIPEKIIYTNPFITIVVSSQA